MNELNDVLALIREMLRSVKYMVDHALSKTTQCYDGVIISQAENGKWNIRVNGNVYVQDILDASCIAGSRAVQDKADIAAIIMPLRKKEEEVCNMIMESHFADYKIRPNRIIHLYKMRFTSEEQGIKVWVHLNLSTGRITDFWVTDKYDKPYELNKTKLEYK